MSIHLMMGNENYKSETLESEEIERNGLVSPPILLADNIEKMR